MTSPSKERTEAHRDAAIEALGPLYVFADVVGRVSAALANAEREGMKRAAENLDQIANAMWERTESVRDANDNEATKEEAEDATTAHCFQRAAQMVREEMGA